MELRDRAMEAARVGFKGIVRLTLATGVLFGLWTALHFVRRRPLPPPRYTLASLPAPPPPEQNGWRDLQARLAPAAGDPPAGTAGAAGPGPREALRVPEIPRGVEPMVSSEVPPRPEVLAEKRGEIAAALAQEPIRQALGLYQAAIARPHFADDCPVGLAGGCNALPLLRLHRIDELSILGDWSAGRWAEATGGVARLVRADGEAASTARSLFSHLLTLSMLGKSLALADALAGQAPAGATASPEGTAAAEGLSKALRGVDPAALTLDRALVVEYLLGRQALVDLEQSAEAPLSALPGRGLLFYDPGRTAEEFERFFAEQEAFVKDPARAAPAIVSYRSPSFWWVYNPVGKSVLDALMIAWESPVTKYAERRGAALASRDRAAEKLQKLLTR